MQTHVAEHAHEREEQRADALMRESTGYSPASPSLKRCRSIIASR